MLPREEVRRLRGLTEAEAAARLRAEGPNELPAARPRSLAAQAVEVLREPMILLLAACAAVYLGLGDRQEATILIASVLVVIGISLWQERKTERARAGDPRRRRATRGGARGRPRRPRGARRGRPRPGRRGRVLGAEPARRRVAAHRGVGGGRQERGRGRAAGGVAGGRRVALRLVGL